MLVQKSTCIEGRLRVEGALLFDVFVAVFKRLGGRALARA